MSIRRDISAKYSIPPELPQRKESYLDLEFRVMTALYGGGAEAGHNDVEDPFRIPAIRGQLRFWWRATAGAQYANPDDLRKAEAAIWGSTELASKVRLRMLFADRGTERAAAGMGPSGRWEKLQPDYALFPAQEDRKHIGNLYFGGRFRLEVAVEGGVQTDVDTALWAWVTFGGIGGRTRRGAGSLYCAPYTYQWREEAIHAGANRGWPVLTGGTAVMGAQTYSWQRCWEQCIEMLRDFRQKRYRLRGRSTWPEPDQIRRLTEQWAPQHAPVHPEKTFPRARLGLPIIFHFKTPEDPEPTTLNVMDKEGTEARMASPVILKPWAVSPTEAIPLLVVLNAPEPENVRLRQGKREFELDLGRNILPELVAAAEQAWGGRKMEL